MGTERVEIVYSSFIIPSKTVFNLSETLLRCLSLSASLAQLDQALTISYSFRLTTPSPMLWIKIQVIWGAFVELTIKGIL